MNKPRLIKRGTAPPTKITQPIPTAVTIQKTVTVVKDWLGTRRQTTGQSARAAFASLFSSNQETCTEC